MYEDRWEVRHHEKANRCVAVLSKVTNVCSEANNAKTQRIKRLGCGYRNRERFRNAIYFHVVGLDLYPDGLVTHTNS